MADSSPSAPVGAARPPTESRPKRRRRGEVTVFPNWCKGCGLCVAFCPMQVLEQKEDGRVIVAHAERCTACRWCELRCPDFAIFVHEVEEE
ncbi:MAG: 4Fe-4S binding protein [Anaerolineae bacterium]|nr:4Fe-4S binding protein [Anaerolineae bacterium]MDW8067841.1 4Fe-4S binding protein [Anaerolineae bacterium]